MKIRSLYIVEEPFLYLDLNRQIIHNAFYMATLLLKDSPLFKQTFGVHYLDELVFEDKKALAWMHKQLKKLKKSKEFAAQNHWLLALFEEEFRKKNLPNVSIKEVNSIVGHGVFAEETLKALTYIGEYTGVVRKRRRKEDKENNYIFRYLETRFRIPYVIDAREKGNVTRFLNHSTTPNLLSRALVIDDSYHIIFFTKQPCHKGEQLTYDYGPFYWKKRPAPFPL